MKALHTLVEVFFDLDFMYLGLSPFPICQPSFVRKTLNSVRQDPTLHNIQLTLGELLDSSRKSPDCTGTELVVRVIKENPLLGVKQDTEQKIVCT